MKITLSTIALSFLLTLASTGQLKAQAGTLDSTFSGDGKATNDFGSYGDYGYEVVLQTDGKIVVAGSSWNGQNYDFALVRYTSSGVLDNTFGTGGKVTTAISNYDERANTLIIQSDGKIIAAGYSDLSGQDFALVRYNANGSLDTSFGVGGKVVTTINIGDDVINALAIQPDGKIIAAGNSNNVFNDDYAFARYFTNGTIDTTFGWGGIQTMSFGNSNDNCESVVIQSDGKIILAGDNSVGDFAMMRWDSTAHFLDNTFGSGGFVSIPIGPYGQYGNKLILLENDKLLLAGNGTDTAGFYNFLVARYDNNGTLDSTFGTNGSATVDFSADDDQCLSMAVQNDGKIVLAGFGRSGGTADFALARFDSIGNIDNTFGTAGKVVTPFGTLSDVAYSVCIQPDNKIVVAGYTNSGTSYDFAIGRYKGGCIASSFTQSPVICNGESVIVGTHTYSSSGSYSDTLTSATGCDSIVTTNLTVNPTYQVTVDTTIYDGQSVTVGTHTYTNSGTYIDVLIASNGCDSTVTTNITAITGINEFVSGEIQIFPNPFSTELLVIGTEEKQELVIMDVTGKEVIRQKTTAIATRISTVSLLPGIYLINYNHQYNSVIRKLVKF